MNLFNPYSIPIEKVKQLEQMLKDEDIDALLLVARENSDPLFAFLTGEEAIHICAAIFRANGDHCIICSMNDYEKYCVSGIFTEKIAYEHGLFNDLRNILLRDNPNRIALNFSETDPNADGLTFGLYLALCETMSKEWISEHALSGEKLFQELHSVKSDTEIQYLRTSIQITNDIYDEVFAQIRKGMSEREIGDLFVQGLKKHGVINGLGEPYSYPIVCIVRAGLAHRSPGQTELEEGDIVICDFSINYRGYISDIARTGYCLREEEIKPPFEVQHAFEAAHAAITETINYISEGKKGYEVDLVGRSVIEKNGYPTVRHSVGHPIGTLCHDSGTLLGPKSRNGSERKIKQNEVYAIEPTVIQDNGLPCMLVEENVVIRREGAEVLSRRQNDLYLIRR